jgi:DNA-binding XRE family transcriptional regulator
MVVGLISWMVCLYSRAQIVMNDTGSFLSDWSGASLKAAREAAGLSLKDMAESTRIRKGLIEAIENEDYGNLPAPVFTKGPVVQIAKKLGLPESEVADSYLRRRGQT